MFDRRLRIGVVAPARAIDRQTEALARDVLASRADRERFELVFHPACFQTAGHFAGSDADRSAAFLEFANDPSLNVIWFAKGGYGSCRLQDDLFAKLRDEARRKVYLGYSDTGMILARLYRERIGQPVHGPMVSDVNRDHGEVALHRVFDYLSGQKARTMDRNGCGNRRAAFNITVLSHIAGTHWMPDLSGHEVLLEDVAEHLYSIDRNFFSLTTSPDLQTIAGIRLGRCSDIPENDIDFGETVEEIARNWCERRRLRFLGPADIGHDVHNKIVEFGPPP